MLYQSMTTGIVLRNEMEEWVHICIIFTRKEIHFEPREIQSLAHKNRHFKQNM